MGERVGVERPSGQQLELRAADARAVITEVGAGIRVLELRGVDVLDGFDEGSMCDGGRGQTMLPWPNRVADGRYDWEGQAQQLPLTEPSQSNAIHGLTRWANWELIELRSDAVHLRHRLHAQPGWPFVLRCDQHYSLSATDGLEVTTSLLNVGAARCPVAAGAHPYLAAGGGLIDDCELEVPADTFLPTDGRGIPVERRSVEGSDVDFRSGRRVGDQHIDLTFTDLQREADGRAHVRFRRPDGRTLELWAGERYRYLEIFSGDTLAPSRRRQGLGVEPMTAPPNALQTGEDLIVLEPGESVDLQWGVGLQ